MSEIMTGRLTLSLPCLLHCHSETTNKNAKSGTIKAFFFSSSTSNEQVKGFLSKCTVLKVRFVTAPSNVLFAGVYVCIFQPGYFTAWVSEGVKRLLERMAESNCQTD